MYRNSNPATSAVAAQKHQSKLSERYEQVLKVLRECPNSTAGELAYQMYVTYPELSIIAAAETPHKRLHELVKQGAVRITGVRQCRETGYDSTTYEVTD
jgi:hypothetical protein